MVASILLRSWQSDQRGNNNSAKSLLLSPSHSTLSVSHSLCDTHHLMSDLGIIPNRRQSQKKQAGRKPLLQDENETLNLRQQSAVIG